MTWVWSRPRENIDWGADIDYELSAPMNSVEYLFDKPVDPKLRPVFKSQTGLKKFKNYHCPPTSTSITVDTVWRDIIRKFVPGDRVQFLPIRIIARGETCDDFMWLIPFDRVRCIDVSQSDITDSIVKPNITLIFGVRKFVHLPNCLGNLHLARDEQMTNHMLVSDELKNALSATGQDSCFYRPEDVPTIYNMGQKLPKTVLN